MRCVMDWDDQEITAYVGRTEIIDMDSPSKVGESVNLTLDNMEFTVKITSIEGSNYAGNVVRIGPEPKLEAAGIKRNDNVTFQANHIRRIYRE